MLHTVCICEHPSTRDHEPTARENKTEHKRIKQVGMLCVLSLLLALQNLKASQISKCGLCPPTSRDNSPDQ
jgi:hypothetical protein